MNELTSLDAALGATGALLRDVAGKVGDVSEVEVGTTKDAVRVFREQVLCGAKEGSERLRAGRSLFCRVVVSVVHDVYASVFSRAVWLWPAYKEHFGGVAR